MQINKNKVIKLAKYIGIFSAILAVATVSRAAFADKAKFTHSTFSVGSSDIRLLNDPRMGTDPANLRDEISGPSFTNITPNWTQDYYFKLYNNGTTMLHLTSNADYETANDPDELRSYIFVKIIEWNDDGNGQFDHNEEGVILGDKSIVKWKTEGFDLGGIGKDSIRGYILRFYTTNLSDTKQGKTGAYDFEINAVQM